MNDFEWVKNLSKKYRSSLADQTQQKVVLVEKQRTLEESTANLFSKLRAAFDAKVQIFNNEIGQEVISFSYQSGSNSFSVKCNAPAKTKTIIIRCDDKTHTFTVFVSGKTPGDIKKLTVEVNDGYGKGYLAENGNSTTPDEVAQTTIESLLATE